MPIRAETSPCDEAVKEDAKTEVENGANSQLAAGGRGLESGPVDERCETAKRYKLSPERWHFLFAVTSLFVTDVFVNEHACLLSLHVASLEMDLPDYVNLYQSLFVIPIVVPFLGAQLMDSYGLKPVIWGTFALACVRNLARILLFSPGLPHWRQLRLLYWLIMRGLAQTSFSIFTCMPLKLSELWFPESERSLALSVLMTAPAVGIAGAGMVYPRLVTGMDNCHWLNYCNAGAILVSLVALLAGVRRSEPAEGPPSSRCELKQQQQQQSAREAATNGKRPGFRMSLATFGGQMLRVCRSKNLMIQIMAICVLEKVIIAVFVVVQDIFEGAGFSNVFTGAFISFQMLAACLIQIFASSRLKPRRTELDPYNTRTCKLLLVAKTSTLILFTLSLVVHEFEFLAEQRDFVRRYQWLLLIASSLALTVAMNCARPYFNEQTAELIVGVTSEANSSACQNAFGAIVFNVAVFVFVRLRRIDDGGSSKLALQPNTTTASSAIEVVDFDYESLHDQTGSGAPTGPASIDVAGLDGPGRPLYLRSMVSVWLAVILGSLVYLFEFDSSSGRRRERARRQSVKPPRQRALEIELTKL